MEASKVLVPFLSFLQVLFITCEVKPQKMWLTYIIPIKSVKFFTWCMVVSPFNAKLSNVWSDGRKSERNCGDEATQFGRREPEDSGSFKR